MEHLVDDLYPEAEKIRVVLDNLSTHTGAAFYEAFPAERARSLSRKIEFIYTPVHGSWLNMAEIEISILSRQCLKQRIASLDDLKRLTTRWTQQRNTQQARIKWCFDVSQARTKLARLYP